MNVTRVKPDTTRTAEIQHVRSQGQTQSFQMQVTAIGAGTRSENQQYQQSPAMLS